MPMMITIGRYAQVGDEVRHARSSAGEGEDLAVGAGDNDDHEYHDRHFHGTHDRFLHDVPSQTPVNEGQDKGRQRSCCSGFRRGCHTQEYEADDHEDDEAKGQQVLNGGHHLSLSEARGARRTGALLPERGDTRV